VLRAYGVSDQGRIRTTNEDCFAVAEDLQFCVVADGMGGHNAGEIAARLVVDTLLEFIRGYPDTPGAFDQSPESAGRWPFGRDPVLSEAGNRIRTAIHLANLRILEASIGCEAYAGMGTTVVAALVEKGRLSVAHVGDSRLYVLGGRRLRSLTRDDSWTAAALASDPSLDPVLARHHRMRNALTNVVGARVQTDVHLVEEDLAGNELLLLTTDGVHGTLDDERLERLMLASGDEREMAATIVAAALARGSHDNCTALVARYLP